MEWQTRESIRLRNIRVPVKYLMGDEVGIDAIGFCRLEINECGVGRIIVVGRIDAVDDACRILRPHSIRVAHPIGFQAWVN